MTIRRVVFRPAAEDDLAQLYRDITTRSGYPERAIGYVRRIRRFCDTLASFPERGQRRDDVRSGLWVISFERRVIIAYMILDTGDVEIGRIFYGGRDYEAIIREDEE
ncbi:MAG: type II toxin-antitoxin system RelE/ParE family toxin [Candidatus Tectomicrobia bacterium]|uniref:Type II toxin-antitoxin system RelE/ParE family toxin n=1 Tax=Tectimicrobiota bacterium TaxID=2528274 RepID=A0A937W3T0_UNCTE|nr:type II toxin-antitoxin system RelE/ParE family toxin [Candidatus Tectomicrobia bacterium]